MPTSATTSVTFEGKRYDVPQALLDADAKRGTTMTRDFIREVIADEEDRKAQAKARRDDRVEAEFKSVTTKLAKVDAIEETLAQLTQANAAYQVANDALKAQLEALEDSNDGLGSTSSKARAAALELSQHVAGAALMVETMMRHRESLERQVESMQARLDLLESQQQEQIDVHLKVGQQRQQLEQAHTNRLLDVVADAESIAREAEATSKQALSDAQSSQVVTKDLFTRDEVNAMVTAELQKSMPEAVEMAVEKIKNEFPNGIHGPRLDGDYVREATKRLTPPEWMQQN